MHRFAPQLKYSPAALLAALLLNAYTPGVHASDTDKDCSAIDDDSKRLSCYDLAAGRIAAPPGPASNPPPARGVYARPGNALANLSKADPATLPVAEQPVPVASASLDSIWELAAANKRGTFRLTPHKLNYILPASYSSHRNTSPSSPASNHGAAAALTLEDIETKFQISSKVKVWENIFGDNGDLWLAYTQQSNWQSYNGNISSPFRETNYEPEAILSLRTEADILGWRWRMLNIGFVHQSNGRSLPESRSWNRIYAQFGFERDKVTVLARPWVRVPEGDSSDDNPDIRDYMGSGDVRVVYANAGHLYSILGRYSFGGGRGGLQVDWAFPISGALKGYLQMTTGYGASLIDYNHRQNTFGIGILLAAWR